MKTTPSVERRNKTNKEEEIIELTLKDYRGTFNFKMDISDARLLTTMLDDKVNWHELKSEV